MTYRKVGGLHFVTVGRIGLTFWARKRVKQRAIDPLFRSALTGQFVRRGGKVYDAAGVVWELAGLGVFLAGLLMVIDAFMGVQ